MFINTGLINTAVINTALINTGAGQPPGAYGSQCFGAERVHAACGELVGDQRMQALYPLGHAAGRLSGGR